MLPILNSVATFCLLLLGLMDADVFQTPKHCVTGTGKKITLECSQSMNHNNMYWYRQDAGRELQLLHYSYGVNNTEKGDVPSESTVSRLRKDRFSLTLESASPSQTSLYLCATSSVPTALLYLGSGSPTEKDFYIFKGIKLVFSNGDFK
uniref:Ig-like domain-containing protein n=1 Tax=Equus asinus asinus TaxID=83772 RepID=A0A8C4PL85_EQUAS